MRLGIFGQPDGYYVRELVKAAHRSGHEATVLEYSSITAGISKGASVYRSGGLILNDLDCVIVRTMPPGTLEQVVARMDILAGLEATGCRVVNSPRSLECAVDKYLTTHRLANAGLPVPDTLICETAEEAMNAWDQLGRDVVVKPLFGAEGRGIIRVTDTEIAGRAFRTLERLGAVLYLQKFIHGPGFDLRVLCLNGEVIGSIRRTPHPEDFRANLAQRGTAMPHQPTTEERTLALHAAAVTGAVFAGVDLMYHHDGTAVIIEVNAVPGWKGLQATCGVDVPQMLLSWLASSPA